MLLYTLHNANDYRLFGLFTFTKHQNILDTTTTTTTTTTTNLYNNMTVFGKTNLLARSFLLLCYLLRRAEMLPSKFEANLMLHLGVR